MLAAWLLLHWGILPHIDEWRPSIETQASRVLGQRLTIARIDARSTGWVPAFELHDVRIFDRQGREALRLAKVSAALSPRSLLLLKPRFAQLLVDGANLDVRRDVSGRMHVAGFDVDAGDLSDDSAAADWMFEQQEWVLRGGSLRWTDELRGQPPLALADVQLVLRNGLRSHDLRLDATPPPDWGRRFSLRGRFTQPLLARGGDWQRWSGSAYAELPQADIGGLGRLVALPFELMAGRGALRAWIDIDRGRPAGVTVDLALAEVSLRLAPALEPLTLRQVTGRLEATQDTIGVRLAATDFGFRTEDGQAWPLGRLKLGWQQAQGAEPAAPVTGGEFSADRLDLDLMARLASRLPLGTALRGLLVELAPRGVLNRLTGSWEGAPDAPRRYKLQSQLSGLTVAAADRIGDGAAAGPARPGLRNADLDFSASERGGEAVLSMADGALEFPGVFAEPRLPLQRLSARLAWTLQPAAGAPAGAPPTIELTVRNARFASADAEGELDAVWKSGRMVGIIPGVTAGVSPGPDPGHLEMTGKITRARADRVARYLPLALPASVRDYVADSVAGGQVDSASFRVKGDVQDFPYIDGTKGEFRISAKLRDVQFAYVPSHPPRGGQPGYSSAWPALTQVGGELDFEGTSMRIRAARASLGNVQLRGITGEIKDFQRPLLQIEGQGRGPADEFLRFANGTPVVELLGDSLRQTSASGSADLKLALTVPLHDTTPVGVRGAITVAGSTLRLQPGAPPLEDTRGRVDFTQSGYTLAPSTARIFGGEASFEGGSAADGSQRFSGRGTASADGLRRASEAAALAPLTARLRGQASYAVQATVRRGHPEITLTSNLVGLAIDLPAPLAKTAEASWPLRWQNTQLPEAASVPVRDSLRFDLGSVLQARAVRDLSGPSPRLERGGIGVFSEAPAPASGLAARLKLGAVDIDAWRAVVAAWPGAEGSDALALLDNVELHADRLLVGQRRLSKVALNLNRQTDADAATWRARIEADQVDGRIELRLPAGGGGGKVTARLARLSVPPSEAAGVQQLLEAAPASVPALDIVVEQLEWRGRALGRVEVEAINRASPTRSGAREWQLARLNMTVPEAALRASGVWAPGSAGPGSTGRRMVLDFKLDLADSGAFAERFGAGQALRGGKGELQGRVSWAGSPLALDLPSLNGQFALALGEGHFPNADPGAARLLGVLNLQALPRRLRLDFRDLTQEGFAFDAVTGDFNVVSGVVSTSNLQVRGLQAAVLTEGRFDLLHETQGLRVLVVPEISAGTASLAYAAINPVIGLGAFVTQWLLQRPLALAGTREYRVSGGWAEPKIERVQRGAAEASAAASGPASGQ